MTLTGTRGDQAKRKRLSSLYVTHLVQHRLLYVGHTPTVSFPSANCPFTPSSTNAADTSPFDRITRISMTQCLYVRAESKPALRNEPASSDWASPTSSCTFLLLDCYWPFADAMPAEEYIVFSTRRRKLSRKTTMRDADVLSRHREAWMTTSELIIVDERETRESEYGYRCIRPDSHRHRRYICVASTIFSRRHRTRGEFIPILHPTSSRFALHQTSRLHHTLIRRSRVFVSRQERPSQRSISVRGTVK